VLAHDVRIPLRKGASGASAGFGESTKPRACPRGIGAAAGGYAAVASDIGGSAASGDKGAQASASSTGAIFLKFVTAASSAFAFGASVGAPAEHACRVTYTANITRRIDASLI
jgi:hypothetical protein